MILSHPEGIRDEVTKEVAVWLKQEFPRVEKRMGTKREPLDEDSQEGGGGRQLWELQQVGAQGVGAGKTP